MEWEWDLRKCIVPRDDGEDCACPVVACAMCASHYQRARRGSEVDEGLGDAVKLTVRVSVGLAESVAGAASGDGVSQSEWIRDVLSAQFEGGEQEGV